MWTGARSSARAATGVLSMSSFSLGSLSRSTTMARIHGACTAREASRAASSMAWIFPLSTGFLGSKKRMERRRPTTSLNSTCDLLDRMEPTIAPRREAAAGVGQQGATALCGRGPPRIVASPRGYVKASYLSAHGRPEECPHGRAAAGRLDLLYDIEAEVPVERQVSWVRGLRVRGQAFGIGAGQDGGQE